MIASGRSRNRAFYSAVVLAAATLARVLLISLLPHWVELGLPISRSTLAIVTVAATDLVPEVNREPGIRMALVYFLGVVVFFLLRLLAPAI